MATSSIDLKSRLGDGGKGSYILVMELARACQLQIGKLGCFDFKPGYYFYVGSAFGPGGVAARVKHHIMASSRPRWHIDYLRRQCELQEVWFEIGAERLEHLWATALGGTVDVEIPVPGFGATDSHCVSHLFYSIKPLTLTLVNAQFQREHITMFNLVDAGK